MSRRNKNRFLPDANAADTNTTDIETGATEASVIDNTSDDAVDAALAAIEADNAAPVTSLTAVEEVEIEQADPSIVSDPETDADEIEALLAEAEEAEAEATPSDMSPEIEAALAEAAPLTDTETVSETVEEVVETLEAVTEDDVKDVIENDADALLAELDADDATASTTKTKTPRKKKDATATTTTTTSAVPKRDFHSIAAIDKATLTENLDGCNAVKVIEKAQNLIQAIETGKKLSRYTSVAIKRLVEDGKITGKGLVEAFTAENLSLGTARAQAQQMTALFRIAGIAQPDATAPKELVIADQGLADELVKLAA